MTHLGNETLACWCRERDASSYTEWTVYLVLLLALAQGVPDLTHFGNKWSWRGPDHEEVFVPQLVMYATPPNFHGQPDKVDRDIHTFIDQHGFHGFHVFLSCRWFDIDEEDCRNVPGKDPEVDVRTLDALQMLIVKTYRAGGMVHLWMWGDEERGQTPSARADWGGLDGPVARKVEAAVAERLGDLPGWSMGYGFDLDEWVSANELHAWRDRMQALLPRFHFLGGRPEGPNRGESHRGARHWNRRLDYASYEHHKPSYQVYVRALEANPDKPVMSEDHFRVLENSDQKHYSLQDIRRGLWRSTLAGGVANIWGYLMEGGSHELGSAPFPNRGQVRTYFEFMRGRFLRDMERCNPTRAPTLCLRSAALQHYIFYREDAEELALGLDAMDGVQPAVAVDTRKPYAEIRIGELDRKRQLWRAPYRSDWAIAVGVFDRPPREPFVTAPRPPTTPERSEFVHSAYPVSVLSEGDRYYTDRDYTLAVVPTVLESAVWIRTMNDEKTARRESLLTFEITRDVVVYVGFDRRARHLPEWLRGWEGLGERVYVNGDVMGYFELYRRGFSKGEVALGATSAIGADFGDGGRSQYVLAVVPR